MSELTLEAFAHDLRQRILIDAEANSDFQEAEFTQNIADDLTDAGVIDGFEPCHYRPALGGTRVDGFWFKESGLELDLFITDFDNREELTSLTQTEVAQIFKRAENFFVTSAKKAMYTSLEETSTAYGLARRVFEGAESLSKVNIYLISDRVLSERVKSLEDKVSRPWTFSYNIWDLSRLYRLASSSGGREKLEIDFTENAGGGLPCLPAHLRSDTYRSYLVVIPANTLSELYGKYGSRLLEQNVRSFLQIRANVNKGIRTTILNEPEMFFAYNNGITATAQEVITKDRNGQIIITSIRDLQIVNGGQTTATLFHTQRKDKASLDKIFVQMKLSVIDEDRSEEVVPKISEYANTQNRVNAADFFSNHPYHIRMEEKSRRIWAPAQQGAQRETKWFYERARGQYADAQSKLNSRDQKKFIAEYPKLQMFTKTDMAKFENVWSSNPVDVNAGAQKNFAKYAERIGKEWEQRQEQFNDFHYRRLVARAIIFRQTERIVSRQEWYNGGYRANVVAYTIALIARICERRKQDFDFERVWKTQDISRQTALAIAVIAERVYNDIMKPGTGVSNISEWCKRPACWLRLQQLIDDIELDLDDAFFQELVSLEDAKDNARSAEKTQKSYNGIAAQTAVVNIPADEWKRILNTGRAINLFDSKEIDILKIASQIPDKIPTDKQSEVLLHSLEKARLEGIYKS